MKKLNKNTKKPKLDDLEEIKADKTVKKITIPTIKNKYVTDTGINKQINNNEETEDETARHKDNNYKTFKFNQTYSNDITDETTGKDKYYQRLADHGLHERAEQYLQDRISTERIYNRLNQTETTTTIQDVIINDKTSTLPRHITTNTETKKDNQQKQQEKKDNKDVQTPLSKREKSAIKKNKQIEKQKTKQIRIKGNKLTPNKKHKKTKEDINSWTINSHFGINDFLSPPQINCAQTNNKNNENQIEKEKQDINDELWAINQKNWDEKTSNEIDISLQEQNLQEEQTQHSTTINKLPNTPITNKDTEYDKESKTKNNDNENKKQQEEIAKAIKAMTPENMTTMLNNLHKDDNETIDTQHLTCGQNQNKDNTHEIERQQTEENKWNSHLNDNKTENHPNQTTANTLTKDTTITLTKDTTAAQITEDLSSQDINKQQEDNIHFNVHTINGIPQLNQNTNEPQTTTTKNNDENTQTIKNKENEQKKENETEPRTEIQKDNETLKNKTNKITITPTAVKTQAPIKTAIKQNNANTSRKTQPTINNDPKQIIQLSIILFYFSIILF